MYNDYLNQVNIIKNQLENIRTQPQNFSNTIWTRLEDYIKNMSLEQKIYTNSQEEVKNANLELMQCFNQFLFDRFKNDFGSVENYKPFINKYIDIYIENSKGYKAKTQLLEEENENLKKRLDELEKKIGSK